VLSYVTPVLSKTVTIQGAPIADIFASTTGTDGDFVVKLIDVYPVTDPVDPSMGGYQLLVALDIFRGRYRHSFSNPSPIPTDQVQEYKFRLPTTNYEFRPDHRIMVQIQSTLFPLYDRNPQAYVPSILFAKPADYRRATVTIEHGSDGRSAVLLPVVAGAAVSYGPCPPRTTLLFCQIWSRAYNAGLPTMGHGTRSAMNQLDVLRAAVGDANVLTGADAAPYLTDWRERYSGHALAVVRPKSTDEVAAVVRACADAGAPIVPQGGNTGLCGGATPDESGRAVVLCLQRLNRIRGIDLDNDTMEVEAGCVLQAVQEAAHNAGRLFPLSMGSEGSCMIGGNLATNAGGTQVLRYGSMRELTLGLEVVTAQGEIWHGLRALRKDNTGYDLRDLFIGSEGTLGIITAATLKLYPLPVARCTALLALASIEDAITMLARARHGFGASLTGFELMAGDCLADVVRCFPQQRLPFDGDSAALPWYALLELSDSESEQHARERFETVLGEAIESGCIQDAVIAGSTTQSKALWHLRESIPLAEKASGKSIKHDVSIPVSRMTDFVEDTNRALQQAFPGIHNVVFGHLGDGNLHYNVARSGDLSEADLMARQEAVYALVHDAVHAVGGSISAEHGVGQLKRDALVRYKDPVELALMHSIKLALDPQGIMNPGKVLAVSPD
jgi:FAD/FMN-containing dehydrogenase